MATLSSRPVEPQAEDRTATVERIYYYPYTMKHNRYGELERQILSDICPDVLPLRTSAMLANLRKRRKSTAILNFFEDRMGYHKGRPLRTLFENLVVLVALRLSCRRVLWVRHNHWPHGLNLKSVHHKIMLACMRFLTTATITHRRLQGSGFVVPHPLYFEGVLPQSVRDIDFLCFGMLAPYKGLAELLAMWPPNHGLTIAGHAPDADFVCELKAVALRRGLNVDFILGYLPEERLESLLLRAKYVVQAHREDSAIVSGAFYHAASLGANILANRSKFSDGVAQAFDFVTTFDFFSLADVITRLRYVDPHDVVERLRAEHGADQCRRAWLDVFALTD